MKLPILLCTLFTSLSVLGESAQWTQFHGPAASGVAADDQAVPAVFGPEKNLLWKMSLPVGHSSPCIWSNRVFITGYQKDTKTLQTLCLDRSSGNVLWRQELHPTKIEKVHRTSSPATATPATDGQLVFVYFGSHGLLAYDFEGHLRWEKKLPAPVVFLDFGSGSSPIVAEDKVIVDLQLGADAHLLAVRAADGETAWKADKPNARGWSTPIFWKDGQAACVGVANAGRFTAYNLKDGTERWWFSGLPNQVCATPLVNEGVVYLNGTGVFGESENIVPPPTFAEALTKYDQNKDGALSAEEIPKDLLYVDRKNSSASGNQKLRDMLFRGKKPTETMDAKEWDSSIERLNSFASSSMMTSAVMALKLGGKGEAKDTQVIWSQPKGVPEVPSMVLYRNRLYAVKAGGVVTCRDPRTGKALFEERLGAPGGYYSSPVASGGRIYTASDLGVITILPASDQFEVAGRVDLGEPIQATPAIVEGKLYVRTDKHLFAFGEKN
jgi:outer membrane protein assembly factor BamB